MIFGLGRGMAYCIPALLLITFACGGPSRHETLVKDGRDAEKQERWVDAAAIYQSACDIKPDDTATCDRARQMREYAVDLRAYRAQEHCDAGQLKQCLEVLAPVRTFKTANSKKVLEVLRIAGVLAIKQCWASEKDRQSLVPAIGELRCLMGIRESLWDDLGFRVHYGARSKAIAAQLHTRASLAAQDSMGAQLSYRAAAQCLVPLTAQQKVLHDQTQVTFLHRAQTVLDLKYTANGTTRPARGTCLALTDKIGRGLRCEGVTTPLHPTLALTAEVFSLTPRWKRTYQDHRESVRYKAGTETRTNPDYERARVEYELADGHLRDAESVEQDREARCRETSDESDCNAAESAEDTTDDRRQERDRARNRFHNEPATITEDVFKDHSYVVRDHEWKAPFRATISVGANGPANEITEIVYRDSEQPGFSEAGVRADRFDPPGKNYFRDESSRWLSSRLEAQLLSELSNRAHQLVDTCKGDRVECWATASFWLGTTEFGLPLLQQLSVDTALPALECTGPLL